MHTYICIYIYLYICICICIHIYTYLYVYIFLNKYRYICIHIYIYGRRSFVSTYITSFCLAFLHFSCLFALLRLFSLLCTFALFGFLHICTFVFFFMLVPCIENPKIINPKTKHPNLLGQCLRQVWVFGFLDFWIVMILHIRG